jgi:hypothetical protein
MYEGHGATLSELLEAGERMIEPPHPNGLHRDVSRRNKRKQAGLGRREATVSRLCQAAALVMTFAQGVHRHADGDPAPRTHYMH